VPVPKGDIRYVSISLRVDGELVLLVILAADGSVNRVSDGRMYMGKAEEPLFARFMEKVSDEMLSHAGSMYVAPGDHLGSACKLTFQFATAEGQKSGFSFRYGLESFGLPPEIWDLVTCARELTDPWVERRVRRGAADLDVPLDGEA
jgi:hypothetical protein